MSYCNVCARMLEENAAQFSETSQCSIMTCRIVDLETSLNNGPTWLEKLFNIIPSSSFYTSKFVINRLHRMASVLSETDFETITRQVLCEATLHDNTDLISRILHRSGFDREPLLNHPHPRPLFSAMSEGNLPLVEFYLRSGSSVSLASECPTPRYVPCLKMWFHLMSAVEYACMLDRTDILKLVLFYDMDEIIKDVREERDKALHYAALHGAFNCVEYLLTLSHYQQNINADLLINSYDHNFTGVRAIEVNPLMAGAIHGLRMIEILINAGASATFVTPDGNNTLLHIVADHAYHYCIDGRLSELTEIIRLCINSGACLDSFNNFNDSPFDALIFTVDCCEINNVLLLTQKNIAIFDEAAQLLLPVKPNLDEQMRIRLLENILGSDFLKNSIERLRTDIAPFSAIRAKLFSVLAKTVRQLLAQGEINYNKSSCYLYEYIVRNAEVVTTAIVRGLFTTRLLHLQSIMDSLSDMFRSIVLSGIGQNMPGNFLDEWFMYPSFVESFVMLAGFSSAANRSAQLIRFMLQFLSGSQLDTLFMVIEEYPLRGTIQDDIIVAAIPGALSWVRRNKSPRRLEHQACCAVTRALSYRSLDDGCLEGLQLPVHLYDSILLKYSTALPINVSPIHL